MKIAVISPNLAHREEIGRTLQADARTIALYEGGASKVPVVADQQHPNLIILDSMCRDLDDLRVVEYVTAQHSQTVVVMICAKKGLPSAKVWSSTRSELSNRLSFATPQMFSAAMVLSLKSVGLMVG